MTLLLTESEPMIHDDTALWGLPDPHSQSEFYENTPAKRLIAFVIDLVIVVVLSALIVPLTAFTGIFYFPFLVAIVGFAYRVVTLARSSATVGMRMMGIEFRTSKGEHFDLGMAFLHTAMYTVWSTTGLPQIISVILMLTTARKQGLSDLILGSAAINRPSQF
ncbi:MAG: RDD family protein [Pacificibacter sp.]|uniref:RDD family protein n=1 Tax=Pacificibacter sp. TaxID=1917866 RepID=UPI00321AD692